MRCPLSVSVCVLTAMVGVAVGAEPANGPTTKTWPIPQSPPAPTTPLAVPSHGAIVDVRDPAFTPKFARVDNPSAGQFAERQHAQRYTVAAPVWYGSYGYSYSNYGYGYATRAWGGGYGYRP